MSVERAPAQVAYEAYCQSAHWRSYDGKPLPAWDAVRPDIKGHWAAAAMAILQPFLELAEELNESRVARESDAREALEARLPKPQGPEEREEEESDA